MKVLIKCRHHGETPRNIATAIPNLREGFNHKMSRTSANRANREEEKGGAIMNTGHWIYRRYITRNGRRIYPRRAKAFRIWVEDGGNDR